LVDKYSEVYYDPTSLLEVVKKATEDEQVENLHNRTPMQERNFGMPNIHPVPLPPRMGVEVGIVRELSPHRSMVNYQYTCAKECEYEYARTTSTSTDVVSWD
jgi:hypothetical protein